jgi:hypothetical protein
MRGTLCLVAVLAAGCSSDRSYALVSVLSSAGTFDDVAQLRVEVRNGSYQDLLTYPRVASGTKYRFDETTPLTFSVSYLPSSHTGTLEVAVTTLDATGASTGHGSQSQPIAKGDVTKVSVRVMRGGAPPGGPIDGRPPEPTTCEPMTAINNPACGPNQTCIVKCRANGSTFGACTSPGTQPPGAICSDDCELGSACFTFACDPGPAVRTCLRSCTTDADCGEGRCATAVPCSGQSTPYRTCTRPCDPLGPATSGCASGLRCFLFGNEVPDCDCVGTRRTGVDGTPCADSDTCAPGLYCVSMGGAKACRSLCRLDGSATPCAGGRACARLMDPGGFTTYGACVP